MGAGVVGWAEQEFGTTKLGDVRRTRRLVAMAVGAARRPSGRVSEVFDRARDREGAYDFLESPHLDGAALAASVFAATASRARDAGLVHVAIDGSSLTLTDENGAKGFGPIGSPNAPAKGLVVMNAFAVSREGVPFGIIDQVFWSRAPTEMMTSAARTKRNQEKRFEDKETRRFADAAKNASERLQAVGARAWVVIDREADNQDILLALHDIGCLFTVRARWNRGQWTSENKIREALEAEKPLGRIACEVGRTGRRAARTANVEIRATQVSVRFKATRHHGVRGLRLFAVHVRELTDDDNALDWLLYTNVPVLSLEHAQGVIESYRARWRIEEFHRTWKQGDCNVEDAQLRSEEAVIRWATLLSAVAARIERLKYLARRTPDTPASVEFASEEIVALTLDQQRRTSPRRRRLPEMPTISEATAWVAELGGWIGPRNGPPGSTTLARGLERLAYLVEGIALAQRLQGRPKPT